MRALLSFGFTAALIVAPLASPAWAGSSWCEDDPIVLVEGRQVKIVVGFEGGYLSALTGPIAFQISVPANVSVDVHTPRYHWVQEQVTVSRTLDPWSGTGDIDVVVTVNVAARVTFPTVVNVSGGSVDRFSVGGTSNAVSSISLELARPHK